MRMRDRRGGISWVAGALLVAAAFVAGCERRQAPAVPPTSPIAPPAPPLPTPPVTVDAAVHAADASTDAGDAGTGGGRRAPKRAARDPAADPGRSGALKVKGNLPKPDADKVVQAASPKMRACFEQEKATNPGLAGKVVFRLTVDDRGRVSLGEVVTSTLGGGDAEMCMVRATRDLKFPAAEGESTVEFQMAFGR